MSEPGPRRPKPQGRRWLRYEISRLATWRNLAIAAIIAIGGVGVVLVVALNTRTGRSPIATGVPASNTPPVVAQEYYDLAGDRLIPPTPEILAKVDEFLIRNGVLEGFDLFDVQEATGYSIGNVVYVDKGEGWDHACVIHRERKLTHIYDMQYSCGHSASICADPYRDLMYADPQAVADRYAQMLCGDCRSMRRHLDQPPAESKNQQAGNE